ncbi:unnamed protein product [Mesocestoides corti]|uniref:CUE domain-containing protein n=1 Tax=Mesocestoides corti TaxID=53468 RepID=A0A0R3U289_MESCO|nr:unnamed protein product [Mesocestoides corti]
MQVIKDSHWVTKKQYPLFRMPNEQDYSIGKNSQWFMDMSLLVSYYSALVTSPFDMFWSEVMLIFIPSVSGRSSRFKIDLLRDIKSTSIPNDFLSIIKQIYALVLLIHVRASRAHESDDMFLRPFEHRQFLHKNLIFDVPGLIDFAALYGHDSPDLVSDIFKSVFENGSEYIKDSGNIMESAVAALEMVGKRVGEWQFETNHQPVSSDTDAFNTVEKTIEYLADAGKALGVFLALVGQVNSSVAETCLQLNIVPKLANFYNTTIIGIRRHILRNITWTHDQKSDLMSKLATAAAAFLKLVRVGIIEPALVHKIMQLAFDAPDPHRADASAVSSKAESLKKASHLLLALMMEMLNCSELVFVNCSSTYVSVSSIACSSLTSVYMTLYRLIYRFAIAYASLYHVDDDIILLRETSKSGDLDKQQLDYIQQCFSQLTAESVGRREQAVKVEVAPPSVSALLGDDADAEPQPGPSRPREFLDVKEVCPETNDDLIVRCLDYYKNDSAAVISALLDDNVPPEVMDPDAVKHTASVKENLPLDAFTRTMDLASAAASGVEQLRPGQLWQGKRNADAETQPLSKDDRDRITQLAVSVWDDDDEHSGDFFVQPNTNGLVETIYDDEYDDTYDGDGGIALERVAEEEAEDTELNLAFGGMARKEEGKEKFSDSPDRRYSVREDAAQQQPRKNVLPIENPEVVRERNRGFGRKTSRRGRNEVYQQIEVPRQPMPPETDYEFHTRLPDNRANAARGRGYARPPQNRGRYCSNAAQNRVTRQADATDNSYHISQGSEYPSERKGEITRTNNTNGYDHAPRAAQHKRGSFRGGGGGSRSERMEGGQSNELAEDRSRGYENQGDRYHRGDTSYSRRLKQRYGDAHNQRRLSDMKRRL